LGENSQTIVAPFWADVDSRGTGQVHFSESTNANLLDRVNREIKRVFPAQVPFTASYLFIVTWKGVGYFDSKTDKIW